MLRGLVVVSLLCLVGCATLQRVIGPMGSLEAPDVDIREVTLVKVPTRQNLSAYFCPRVVGRQMRMGADLLCQQFFGPAPAQSAMDVAFDVRLRVLNPNEIPLPLSSVLTAITLYPEQSASELGAACISLCPPDDPACSDDHREACPPEAVDITNPDEVRAALGQLVVSEGARLASGEELGIEPQVLANQALDVVVRLAFDPRRMLPVMEQFARDAADELAQGKAPTFAIPYTLRGALFAETGSSQPLSAPFGPLKGSWEAPR